MKLSDYTKNNLPECSNESIIRAINTLCGNVYGLSIDQELFLAELRTELANRTVGLK